MKAILFLAVVLTCSIVSACPPVQLQVQSYAAVQQVQVQAVQQYAVAQVQAVQAVAVPVYVQSYAMPVLQVQAVALGGHCSNNILGIGSCNRSSLRSRLGSGRLLGGTRGRRSVSRSRATVIQRN